jgi:phosphoserine phosphatase RsbU/P
MTLSDSQNSGDRLALLYQLTQTFNSSLDLDEVLNRVMDEVIAATRAERGFVMLKGNRPDGSHKLEFRVARGIDQTIIEDPQFQISRSIVERVAAEGKPLLTSDAQADERFNLRQSVMILGLRSILCVPLSVKDQVIGIIYVENRFRVGIFTQDDLDLLSSIASTAAIAIENARLYQVAVEKGRMEQELKMARKVQASLLPSQNPVLEGWDFATRWQPARQVGGDYYDFIVLDDEVLAMLIADVTDKGMPAALFMAFTRSVVRASVDRTSSPSDSIQRANRLICADTTDSLFVSLFFGLLEGKEDRFTYVNAGHHPPLFYCSAEDRFLPLKPTGMPLGIEIDSLYTQESVQFAPGDFMVLYTDGVLDAMNVNNMEFGMEALEQVVYAHRALSAGEIVTGLAKELDAFSASSAPVDDITLLVCKKL